MSSAGAVFTQQAPESRAEATPPQDATSQSPFLTVSLFSTVWLPGLAPGGLVSETLWVVKVVILISYFE